MLVWLKSPPVHLSSPILHLHLRQALFSVVFRALIVLFSCEYNIETCKKRSERRKHCALAVVRRNQKFSPCRRPLPAVQDGQNLISWRCHYLYLQTQLGENRCKQFRVIVVTEPHTHRQDRLQYTAPQLASA